MSKSILIKNCVIYDRHKQGKQDLLLDNGKIRLIDKQIDEKDIEVYDAGGRIITPGFIDLHLHGAGGADVGEGIEKALEKMSRTLARFGVTSFLGTTMLEPDTNNHHLTLLNQNLNKKYSGANVLGIHMEGPFISKKMRRGIPERAIFPYTREKLDEVLDLIGDNLKMMTLAPEIRDGLKLIKLLKKYGIIPALGHSNATYEETKLGFDAGVNHVTHIFNAMPPLHHRKPGPLLAILESDRVSAQIISDGVHLNPAIVRYLYNGLGKDRCVCITDGIQAIGLPDGKYKYYGREYIKKEGTARYLDGTLIGTTLDTGTIAFKFQEFADCSLVEAINTVTKNPSKVLGISDSKGTISEGKDADLVLLNEDKSVHATFVEGALVYNEDEKK